MSTDISDGVAAVSIAGVPDDAVDISGDGGCCKRILTPGDPASGTPFAGAEVQVHYVGTLLSDGSEFDSSRKRPGNFRFKIGKGQVIKGWDIGVATMSVGEKAILQIPSDYAYGKRGVGPIPGGADLTFELEVVSTEDDRYKYVKWQVLGFILFAIFIVNFVPYLQNHNYAHVSTGGGRH